MLACTYQFALFLPVLFINCPAEFLIAHCAVLCLACFDPALAGIQGANLTVCFVDLHVMAITLVDLSCCRWRRIQLLGLWAVREQPERPADQGGQERPISYDCSSWLLSTGCVDATGTLPEPSRPLVKPCSQQHSHQLWPYLQPGTLIFGSTL